MRGENDLDRLLDQALRTPPIDPIPHDFAAKTAAYVDGLDDDRLERWLQGGLLVAFAAGSVVAIARISGPWLHTAPVAGWGAAIGVCLALSSALDWLRGRTLRA